MTKRYIKIFDIDGEKYIRCPITGERETALRCKDCSEFIRIDPVRKNIVCKFQ